MVKRIVSASMWFLAAGWGFNLLSLITGAPPIAGIAFGAAVAAFIGLDPLHLFWPVKAPTPIVLDLDTLTTTGSLQTQV
jgi:hypothetical protein